ncbi:MAG: hypothetical protein IPM64_15230 [Phycisphaerales bacterium]|nr:hypothetical protein [Phycisphaerales bacterium]
MRYDGHWSCLNEGIAGTAYAIATGPAPMNGLVVGGHFQSFGWTKTDDVLFPHNLAEWRNGRWNAIGTTRVPNDIRAFAIFDDGTGPTLYVGIDDREPTLNPRIVYKWTGTGWLPFGRARNPGLATTANCTALAVYDDGRGPALYVGGNFTHIENMPAFGIARWDGATWEAPEFGVEGSVLALLVHDAGDGPKLYAGGSFYHAGLVVGNGLARWDGQHWSQLPNGGDGMSGPVGALAEFQGDLYAGGEFTSAGGVPALNIARWNAANGWAALAPDARTPGIFASFVDGSSSNNRLTVRALAVYNDGTGPQLYIGGKFEGAGDIGAANLVRWDGLRFSTVAPGNGTTNLVTRLRQLTWNGETAVYALGFFRAVGDVPAGNVARWIDGQWQALGNFGEGPNREMWDAVVFDDGSGEALYVSGRFDNMGGVPARNVAKWDGQSWSALGDGLSFGSSVWSTVWSLAVFDDGRGPALYAGGYFDHSGATSLNHMARWDGVSWSALGSGLHGSGPRAFPGASALVVFDDGRGPALFVGGVFRTAGGLPANGAARWDGANWSTLGSGVAMIDPSLDSGVFSWAVHDDGGGPALYAGGLFERAGGVPARAVARWNGVGWSALGAGPGVEAISIVSFDDGSGPKLHAALHTAFVRRWNGTAWERVNRVPFFGVSGRWVFSLLSAQEATGPALYVGGEFGNVGLTPTGGIARYGCEKLGDANCDGGLDAFDIDWFVLALIRPQDYIAAMPDCYLHRLDVNLDGRVDNFDIDPFVTAIVNGP